MFSRTPVRCVFGVATVVIALLVSTAGAAASAPDGPSDDELVDVLIEAAARADLPMERGCVDSVVAGHTVPWFDDDLARQQLVFVLTAWLARTSGSVPAESTTFDPMAVPANAPFLQAARFVVVDFPELRRQLLRCVGPATADHRLVEDAMNLIGAPDPADAAESECIERMLGTFADDTLRLLVQSSASEADVGEQARADLSRLLECIVAYESSAADRSGSGDDGPS